MTLLFCCVLTTADLLICVVDRLLPFKGLARSWSLIFNALHHRCLIVGYWSCFHMECWISSNSWNKLFAWWWVLIRVRIMNISLSWHIFPLSQAWSSQLLKIFLTNLSRLILKMWHHIFIICKIVHRNHLFIRTGGILCVVRSYIGYLSVYKRWWFTIVLVVGYVLRNVVSWISISLRYLYMLHIFTLFYVSSRPIHFILLIHNFLLLIFQVLLWNLIATDLCWHFSLGYECFGRIV